MKKIYKNKRYRLEFVDIYIPKYDSQLKKKIEQFKSLEKQRMLQEEDLVSLEDQLLFLLEDIANDISHDVDLLKILGINEMITEIEQKNIKQIQNGSLNLTGKE